MYLLMFGVQLTLLVPFVIAFFAITLAFSLIQRRKDESEDDLGYLEIIHSEYEGGEFDEKDF